MTPGRKPAAEFEELGLVDTHLRQLFEALRSLKNDDEYFKFFDDLCTPAELRSLSDRWQVAKLLDTGLPYRSISEATGVSTATVTRVARCLLYGAKGYRLALDRLKKGRRS